MNPLDWLCDALAERPMLTIILTLWQIFFLLLITARALWQEWTI
jgi:hypothetical protein